MRRRAAVIALVAVALFAQSSEARGRIAPVKKIAARVRHRAGDAAFRALQLRARPLRARPGTSRRFRDLGQVVRAYRGASGPTRIVLSPHLDDAVLSLGGSIAAWRAAGERVLVVTFATGAPPDGTRFSKVARGMHDQWKLAPDRVVASRRGEDERALARVGADLVHIGDLDAIYRGALYPGWKEMFAPPDRSDPMRRSVARAIDVLSAEVPGATFYAPLAVGDHVDHALVHEEAMKARGVRMHFYEDLPYAAKRAGALEQRLAAIHALEPHVLALDRRAMAQKLDAAAAYDSQIPALFGDRLAMRRALGRHAARVARTETRGRRQTSAALAERVWSPAGADHEGTPPRAKGRHAALDRRALSRVRLVGGRGAPLDRVVELIRDSGGEELRLEAYTLSDPAVGAALAGALAAHPRKRIAILLHDQRAGVRTPGGAPEHVALASELLRRFPAQVEVVPYGDGEVDPTGTGFFAGGGYVPHGKAASTSRRAVLTTAGFDRVSRGKNEWLAELEGEEARMVHELGGAALRGDRRATRRLARRASKRGVLLADGYLRAGPIARWARRRGIKLLAGGHGADQLARTMRALVRSAGRGDRLYVMTAELRDPRFARQIARARRRGAEVVVEVGTLGGVENPVLPAGFNRRLAVERDRAILAAAGVPVVVAQYEQGYPHGNVIAVEEIATGRVRAYLGSAYAWNRHLEVKGSRELGILVSGAAARELVEGQQAFVHGGLHILHKADGSRAFFDGPQETDEAVFRRAVASRLPE